MKFQTALETAPEHVLSVARTREGWLAIQVAGQWFSVHGSAVTAYEGRVEAAGTPGSLPGEGVTDEETG